MSEATGEVFLRIRVTHPKNDMGQQYSEDEHLVVGDQPLAECVRIREAVRRIIMTMVNMGGYSEIISAGNHYSAGEILDEIQKLMDGREWGSHTTEGVAHWIRESGREVREPGMKEN